MARLRPVGVRLLAAAVTPVIVVLATARDRYLENQLDFGCEYQLLVPYALAALGGTVAGAVLSGFTWSRIGSTAVWAFYLIGPMYLAHRVVRKAWWTLFNSSLEGPPETAVILLLLAGFALILIFVCLKRIQPESAAGILAVAGALLLGNEVYQISTRMVTLRTSATTLRDAFVGTAERCTEPGGSNTHPNIYHLLFDGYQTDMFEHTTSKSERDLILDGFVYFPRNTAVYGRTRFSVASIFYGFPFDCASSQYDYVAGTFSNEHSFLHALKEAGYSTFGLYGPAAVRGSSYALFDRSLRFSEFVKIEDPFGPKFFRNLWLVSSFPTAISSLFVNEGDQTDLKAGGILPAGDVARSTYAFRQFLEIEHMLPESGRYTYLHLMIPHPPVVLDEGCVVHPEPEGAIDVDLYLGQAVCAKRLLSEFCRRLQDLGRYHDSLIIIHADHGMYARVADGVLSSHVEQSGQNAETLEGHTNECATTRSRALLLVKSPGAEPGSGCRTSNRASTLLDIAPSVLDTIGSHPTATHTGHSLFEPYVESAARPRHYHFGAMFQVPGYPDLTVEMARWTIAEGIATWDRTIPLGHTLPK